MKRAWACAGACIRGVKLRVFPVFVIADTEESAKGYTLTEMQKLAPPEEGWLTLVVTAMCIRRDLLTRAVETLDA